VFRIKYQEAFFSKPNADLRHLLDSLVSALAVYATAFRSKLSLFSLIPRNLRIAGSLIGGIRQTQEMIDFCAKHNIVCSIEMIDATPEAVEISWKRTVASDVKFRFVIDTKATLPKLV